MKKLILITVLLFSAVILYAQNIVYANKVSRGIWDEYKQEYSWQPFQITSPIKIYVKSNVLLIFDAAKSFYTMLEAGHVKKYEDGTANIWSAMDEKNRKCEVKFVTYKTGTHVIIVSYSDNAFMYVI